VLFGLSLTPIIIFVRTFGIRHPDNLPISKAGPAVLEKQSETFTCGVHALSAVYRAYGLDPDEERVR
jgi:hypothetical protein